MTVVRRQASAAVAPSVVSPPETPPPASPAPSPSRALQVAQAVLCFALGHLLGKQVHLECPAPSPTVASAGLRIADVGAPPSSPSPASLTAINWTIPPDIAAERRKECDGGRKTSSTGGFCLTRTKTIGGNHWVDTPLGEHLRDNLFRGADVIDLGAGLGHYGKIFVAPGSPVKSWAGFDGAINVRGATDGFVSFMDLTQPHAADERPCVQGDWVLSLEVAEHIPPEFTDSFLRNVRCSCRVGAVVSWAVPSQTGGLGHVNTKEQKDAIAAMARWGFVLDEEASKTLQQAASMEHFKRNTLVYRVAT